MMYLLYSVVSHCDLQYYLTKKIQEICIMEAEKRKDEEKVKWRKKEKRPHFSNDPACIVLKKKNEILGPKWLPNNLALE